jgi:hypothetical protein
MNEKNIELQYNNPSNNPSDKNKPQRLQEDYKEDYKEDVETPEVEQENKKPQILNKTEYMPIPKRLVICSLIFLVIGIVFLSLGLNDYFNAKDDRARSLSFLIFGCLMFLPGIYYVYQVYLACAAGSPEEREEILSDIPNIQF